MHELSITQGVVHAACDRAGGRPIPSIRVQVGALTAVVPDAMLFCFDLVTEGTVAEGACRTHAAAVNPHVEERRLLVRMAGSTTAVSRLFR